VFYFSAATNPGTFSSGEKNMKAEYFVRRGVLAFAFAGLLAGGSYGQSQDPIPQQQDIKSDKKDIRNDKQDVAKDRADRNAARVNDPETGAHII
jgi:hypothetical protein